MIGNGSLDIVLTLSKVSQHFETLTVGVKLLSPPPWFQGGLLDTSPSVRNSLSRKFLLDRSNRGGGEVI